MLLYAQGLGTAEEYGITESSYMIVSKVMER